MRNLNSILNWVKTFLHLLQFVSFNYLLSVLLVKVSLFLSKPYLRDPHFLSYLLILVDTFLHIKFILIMLLMNLASWLALIWLKLNVWASWSEFSIFKDEEVLTFQRANKLIWNHLGDYCKWKMNSSAMVKIN